MLEFEHIVQVNDLNNESIAVLTRNQLWQRLLLRARNPDKFNHALRCKSEKLEENEFIRNIEAGGTSFCERVVLYPEQKICTKTIAEFEQINAQSTTFIEEPDSGALFVRFCYKRDLDVSDERVDVGEHLKAAYVQLDREAIAMIRLLAESELFDQTIN
ncbi:MAG: DUF1857 family protein [Pseudomonadales bacterium]|nr:DUF1857 family protein [Pseudomonadales bacterium]